MSIDHPIGDPTGGPAFGEKKDPISAAISIFTMFEVGQVGFAAMTLMQGITFAGAAVSLIGNISGNKSLMKLGAIAGIAGGLGSFAESQGLFSSGNLQETLGMKSSISDELLKSGSPTVTPGSQTAVLDGVQTSPVTQGFAEGTALEPLAVNAPSVNNPTAATASVNNPNALTTAPGSELTASTAPLGANPMNQIAGVKPGTDILGQPPRGAPQMSYAPGMGPNMSLTPPAAPGVFDQLKAGNYGKALSTAGGNAMDMLKNNPTGAYVAAQAIGGVADWLSGKTDAELDALKANTGYANAKALEVQTALDREKMRRANLNSGYTNVDAGFKVNPNAAVAQPYQQPPGLVAGAMQPRQG
jgi:hypothetical protein|tara:strand:- start:2980 stop:4053 length:1074 start_codon:yes stop_codon:yes gene_type:complete